MLEKQGELIRWGTYTNPKERPTQFKKKILRYSSRCRNVAITSRKGKNIPLSFSCFLSTFIFYYAYWLTHFAKPSLLLGLLSLGLEPCAAFPIYKAEFMTGPPNILIQATHPSQLVDGLLLVGRVHFSPFGEGPKGAKDLR